MKVIIIIKFQAVPVLLSLVQLSLNQLAYEMRGLLRTAVPTALCRGLSMVAGSCKFHVLNQHGRVLTLVQT